MSNAVSLAHASGYIKGGGRWDKFYRATVKFDGRTRNLRRRLGSATGALSYCAAFVERYNRMALKANQAAWQKEQAPA